MRYPVVKASDALLYLNSLRTTEPRDIDQYVLFRGEGPDVDTSFVSSLRSDLTTLRSLFPDTINKRSSAGTDFERQAAAMVHTWVPAAAEVLTDPEFWLWLCASQFKDLVAWRYGTTLDLVDRKNFGIGSAGENFMYRLWLRGEIGLDDEARDKYHLSRRGDIDFWRSHLFRQSYANARTFAKTLLKFQYPDEESNEPRLKIVVVRDLVKRIRRARVNLMTEFLDEKMSLSLINTELAALPIKETDVVE
jgi:hypothetical protein